MRFILKSLLPICFLMLFMGGCATTKTSFRYDNTINNKPIISNLSLAVAYPKDDRIPNKRIDKMWDNDPIIEIDRIIKEEIKSTGLFREIVPMDNNCCRIILYTTLKELAWEVPNYDKLLRNTFMISFLTGGVGGIIYGNTDTDFYGKVRIRLVLADKDYKSNMLDKEYYYRAEEKVTKFKTDSAEERAKIIGIAFKHVIEQFKEDLDKVIKERNLL